MIDPVSKILKQKQLSGTLAKESVENGIDLIDSILFGDSEGNGVLDFEFLRQAKEEAHRIYNSGYNFAKGTVLVPAGFWGLSNGLSAPDLDISTLGIGNHRFFLFHSAIGLVVLKHFYKRWLEAEQDPQKFKSRVIRKVGGTVLGTYAIGVGLHLAVDVFQPKSIVFPFVGSLVDGTLIDDNIWLFGNSLWAFQIGREVFALSISDELEAAKAYVIEKFGPLRNSEEFNCNHI